ncbi:OmpP1/FadL family transporter [Pseudomonas sp. S9]|uniref:OmpP1/FadL family transporter n=1 Tax=Pseudomonas sp. S9 TaxID=686578 RepID=UPI0002556C62|nr:OmpP1/FadL family transporter [Pseudomonas sp. S9]
MLRKVLSSILLLGVAGNVSAGGNFVYEVGQEGAGLANAGAAVLVTDPSILMNNPAGLTALKGTQVNANGQLMLGHINFSRDDDNSFDGNEGGNALKYFPGGSVFASHQINDRATIGIGMVGNFGLAVNYDDDWAGRYFTQKSSIIGIAFQPTLSYKLTDDLSVGFGPRFVFGRFLTEVAVNNNPLGIGNAKDGQLKYQDTDWGMGVTAGLMYDLSDRTRLGLSYVSKVKFKFDDQPDFDDISNPLLNVALGRINADQLNADITIPQYALASISHQLNDHWTVLGSAGWQDWSEFGKIGVEVDGNPDGSSVSRQINRKYKDTWHLSVGAQNQMTNKLRINMGVGYDTSSVDDDDRTVDVPVGAAWRFATGLNYKIDESMSFNLNYTLIWMDDLSVEQSKRNGQTISGEYKKAAIHVLGGGATWRF